MKLFKTRDAAFAFFKLAFGDCSDSEEILRLSCVAAHVLAAQKLQLLAQDVVSWLIARVGTGRTNKIVDFMWRNHAMYESDFSVLNTLLRGFLNVGMGFEALEVLRMMRGVGVRPGLSSITILLRLLLRIGDYGSVWKLFKDMIFKGPRPSNLTFNAMICGFCRQHRVVVGESLLHLMPKFMCSPDVVTFNILINACCIGGRTWVAIDWLHLMVRSGVEPSVATFTTILHALCREGNVVEARKLFDGIQDMGIAPNAAIYNTLMDGYFKAREVAQASLLYEEMRTTGVSPDCVTFNILVGGHYKYGRKEDLNRLLKDSILSGLFLDCLLPDIFTFNILIGGYCKTFDMVGASEIFNKMYSCGLDPDITTYNTRMHGYCRMRKMNKAVIILDQLISAGIVPDTVTYNTMLSGICSDILDRAMIFTAKLLKMGFLPNVITTNMLLSHFCKQGMPEKALIWGQKLREISFGFDEISYRILDQAYCLMQDDVELVRGTYEKHLFMDFLMYITFDYFSRNKPQKIENENSIKLIENQFVAL